MDGPLIVALDAVHEYLGDRHWRGISACRIQVAPKDNRIVIAAYPVKDLHRLFDAAVGLTLVLKVRRDNGNGACRRFGHGEFDE